MKASFYKRLQDDFVMIRFLQNFLVMQNGYDKEKFDPVIASIQEARKKISMHSPRAEKEVLLYCIDTLLAIMKEGDEQKIHDFANAIHNIPEIYMQKRNLYSLRSELKGFQKKYGKHYFPFIDEMKPHFTKKAPENKWEYFHPSSDVDFKQLHPIGYHVIALTAIVAFMLPIVIYSIYVLVISPAPDPDDWSILLGAIGAFTTGTGFFNIIAAWWHQYLGHLLTIVCLSGGTALMALSLYLLYM